MREGRLEEIKARLEGHDSGAYHDASDMAIGFGEVVSEALELVEEVEALRGRLQAVCDVLSDAEGFGEDVDPDDVLKAVRGQREARERVIGFEGIQAGDLLRVSFPPRGGMSDNWTTTYSREAVAHWLMDDGKMPAYWITGDGQTLVSKLDDRAVIELVSRFEV